MRNVSRQHCWALINITFTGDRLLLETDAAKCVIGDSTTVVKWWCWPAVLSQQVNALQQHQVSVISSCLLQLLHTAHTHHFLLKQLRAQASKHCQPLQLLIAVDPPYSQGRQASTTAADAQNSATAPDTASSSQRVQQGAVQWK
jgi:triosephosphate isomerase